MDGAVPDELEREIRSLADLLTTPLPRECLLCFAWRMVDAYGCNATLRWVRHWRDGRAQRATALEDRLGRYGARCDCELFTHGWDSRQLREAVRSGIAPPRVTTVACRGVRRGSARPCGLWVRHEPLW